VLENALRKLAYQHFQVNPGNQEKMFDSRPRRSGVNRAGWSELRDCFVVKGDHVLGEMAPVVKSGSTSAMGRVHLSQRGDDLL
jgi:hypothetical protein